MTFEEIYREYSGRVLNLVYRMTSRQDIARDLTQDIFIKVYNNLGTFQEQSQVYTWVYRIAVNHVLNHIKHERRARWLSVLGSSEADAAERRKIEHMANQYDGSVSADKAMEQDERARAVWSAVQSLSPKYRIPLILHHYEGISYGEIAGMMDITMSAVENRIHRAKQQLIKKLEPVLDQL